MELGIDSKAVHAGQAGRSFEASRLATLLASSFSRA
jgi:hypothetical protein